MGAVENVSHQRRHSQRGEAITTAMVTDDGFSGGLVSLRTQSGFCRTNAPAKCCLDSTHKCFGSRVLRLNLKQYIRRALDGKHQDYSNALAGRFELMAAK